MERESTRLQTGKVPGTPVYSMAHTPIGEVDERVIDTMTGRVRYRVLSFGGLLGIGKSYFPIPWSSMAWHASPGGDVTGITEAQLKAAPGYNAMSWGNRDWENEIHQNYGTPGYWEATEA